MRLAHLMNNESMTTGSREHVPAGARSIASEDGVNGDGKHPLRLRKTGHLPPPNALVSLTNAHKNRQIMTESDSAVSDNPLFCKELSISDPLKELYYRPRGSRGGLQTVKSRACQWAGIGVSLGVTDVGEAE